MPYLCLLLENSFAHFCISGALEQVIDPLVLKNAKILTITAIDTRGVVATYIHMLGMYSILSIFCDFI